MGGTSRETALDALIACRRDGAWSDGYLRGAVRRNGLDERDAALAARMCYGVIQNDRLLDFYIGSFCSQKPQRLEPLVLDILRLGAYQIIFLTKIPSSAAVNESVALAKRRGAGRASGLVNAVLRRISENRDRLPEVPRENETEYFSIKYSYPEWIVRHAVSLLGSAGAEEFLRCGDEAVPTVIQTNTLKTTGRELRAEMEACGIAAEPHPWLDGCFTLAKTGDIGKLDAFREGRFIVQDAAARLAAKAAGAAPGMTVMDVCAAPGGKSFACAMDMENNGKIYSFDIHENKLRLIDDGAKRLGISIITAAAADGKARLAEFEGAADVVIADVPCSGLGIIRKKPDIRRKREEDVAGLPEVQSAILENVSAYVKSGGVLLYSTCTVLPEENERVTDAFLARHGEFLRESFTLPEPIGEAGSGQLTLWPQKYGTDGFYICRMRRR